MSDNRIKILGISGSLRSNSSNTAIIKMAAKLASSHVNFLIYEGLADLPLFDDSNQVPPTVNELRTLLKSADGVFFCTPEYAFGIPGSLKNALDWTVSSGELMDKPVAVITAAINGEKAHASLLLTLNALSATIVEGATLVIPFIRTKLNDKGEVVDPSTIKSIESILNVLVETTQGK
jgi:chromate reductase, NAD(P)H dehydrogenase (quinone)